jgi:glutaredoxin
MKKIVIVLIIIGFILGFFYLTSRKPGHTGVADNEAEIILFWGDGCPHCKIVDKYISDNNVNSKVKISYKEVYYNKTNQNFLQETVKKCPEIDTSQGIGVPMAFVKAENKCLQGDKPIIDWLAKSN